MTRAALATLAITLTACSDWDSLSAGHDSGGPMLPAYCSSGVRDGDETDVDCGGACLPCDVAASCAIAGDCQTRTCVEGRCTLTSAPPRWLQVSEIATPSSGAIVGTSPDGNIYVLGSDASLTGATGMPRPLFSYDPDTAQWRSLAPLDSGMGIGTTFGPSGRLYALGRYTGATFSTDVLAYDPATDSWSADAPFSAPRTGFATAGDETHAYVIGGIGPFGVGYKKDIEVYSRDPMAHFATKSMPETWLGMGNAAAIVDGLVYVFGTAPSMGIYDPNLDTWRDGPAPTRRQVGFVAVVGADRRIYSTEGGEAYDQHGWTSAAASPGARSSARGRDGRIYALGGPDQNKPLPLYAYGPALLLTTRFAPAGGSLLVSASNFATRAVVSFHWDDDATVVASAESDDTGLLLPLMVPVTPGSGTHRLTAIDDRSRYPVSVPVSIQ